MDDPGFESVVAAHHGEIYRYLRRVGRRASEADDLSQETFLRAYRAWRSLEPQANVRAWLFAIATNVYRNHARGEHRRRTAYDAARLRRSELDAGGPEEEAMASETRMLTEAAIGRLPLKQRLAFIMRKLHDVDYDTIGQSLECSAESARAHVFQALKKIRTNLDRHRPPTRECER